MNNTASEALEIKACAKVNLCLAVKYPPTNGYHQLDSVFQELELHDTLRFWTEPLWTQKQVAHTQLGSAIVLDCDVAGLAIEDNLIFRALDAAERACGVLVAAPGSAFSVSVDKHIPAGGGLGGGSSDAAAALKAYAQHASIDSQDERIMSVARKLGADVAFFLHGGAALMDDRGDRLVRKLPDFPLPIVLMGAELGNSTAHIYKDFDKNPPVAPDAYALADAMEDSSVNPIDLAHLCENNLEPAACAANTKLTQRLEIARKHPRVLNALVTGSGSTSFAICPDLESAQEFARDIAEQCAWVEVCTRSAS